MPGLENEAHAFGEALVGMEWIAIRLPDAMSRGRHPLDFRVRRRCARGIEAVAVGLP